MGARESCLGSACDRVGSRRSPVRQQSTGWGFPIPAETDSEVVTAVVLKRGIQLKHSGQVKHSGEEY